MKPTRCLCLTRYMKSKNKRMLFVNQLDLNRSRRKKSIKINMMEYLNEQVNQKTHHGLILSNKLLHQRSHCLQQRIWLEHRNDQFIRIFKFIQMNIKFNKLNYKSLSLRHFRGYNMKMMLMLITGLHIYRYKLNLIKRLIKKHL